MPSKKPSAAAKRGRPAKKPGATTAVRDARRAAIAAGMVEGKPIAEIAGELQISRTWASIEANSPQTKLLIAEMLDARRPLVEELVELSLRRLREALDAKARVVDQKNGRVRETTFADHKVRLGAVKRVIELSLAGRRPPEENTREQTITFEQFLTIYHRQAGGGAS